MTLEKMMLAALERNEEDINCGKPYTNCNSDHDFGAVLNTFSSNDPMKYSFRYSDGKEEVFSFEN